MNIRDERVEKNTQLEVGDFIKLEENYYHLVEFNGSGKVLLIDMETSLVYRDRDFNAPSHVFNHLRKHYDAFEILKGDDADLTFS